MTDLNMGTGHYAVQCSIYHYIMFSSSNILTLPTIFLTQLHLVILHNFLKLPNV